MKEITIGEMARRTDVRASTIRYYERVGLLPEPERVAGRRRYDQEVVDRLALIKGQARRVHHPGGPYPAARLSC